MRAISRRAALCGIVVVPAAALPASAACSLIMPPAEDKMTMSRSQFETALRIAFMLGEMSPDQRENAREILEAMQTADQARAGVNWSYVAGGSR